MVIADTHTNLGAAYILSDPARPDLALSHLQLALEITPDDGQVCFNLAAVLEATGELEEALVAYSRARNLGVERAAVNERNVRNSATLSLIRKLRRIVRTDCGEADRETEGGGRSRGSE